MRQKHQPSSSSILTTEKTARAKFNSSNYLARNESSLRKTSILVSENCNSKSHLDGGHCRSTQYIQSYGSSHQQKGESMNKQVSFKHLTKITKELEPNQFIKDGDFYKKISPKVVFSDNKIEVMFVNELNRYQTQLVQKAGNKQQSDTIVELAQHRVAIKGPISYKSPLRSNLCKASVSKGVLSNQKLFQSLMNRRTERDYLNTSCKPQLQKLLTKQF